MNDKIKQMAALAGAVPTDDGWGFGAVELSAFARLVAEDCVAIADDVGSMHDRGDNPYQAIMDAIRARYGLDQS